MASIYKRTPTSKKYWCQFYVKTPDGGLKKVRKATGKTSQKKAMETAVELERAEQGVMQAGSDRAALAKAVLAECVAEIERETFTAAKAKDAVARLLRLATGEALVAASVGDWLAEWLRRKGRECSASSVARYKRSVDSFLEWLGPDRAKRTLETITPADTRAFRDAIQDSGLTSKSVAKYHKDLKAAFAAALREGLITSSPWASLEFLSAADSQDRKPFTPEEVAALVAAPAHVPSIVTAKTDSEWPGLVLAAAFTGLRLGDVARLRWSSVDLEKNSITLIPGKTRKMKREVKIPLHPTLRSWLLAATVENDQPDAFVFPKLAAQRLNGKAGLSSVFLRIMAAAGVDRGKASREIGDEENATGKGRVTWERGFHSLRHSTATWLRAAGVPEEDRMALLGQTTREVHQKYSHADESALKEAMLKMSPLPPSV